MERVIGISKKKSEILPDSIEPNYGVKSKKLIIFTCRILHNYLMSANPNENLGRVINKLCSTSNQIRCG